MWLGCLAPQPNPPASNASRSVVTSELAEESVSAINWACAPEVPKSREQCAPMPLPEASWSDDRSWATPKAIAAQPASARPIDTAIRTSSQPLPDSSNALAGPARRRLIACHIREHMRQPNRRSTRAARLSAEDPPSNARTLFVASLRWVRARSRLFRPILSRPGLAGAPPGLIRPGVAPPFRASQVARQRHDGRARDRRTPPPADR